MDEVFGDSYVKICSIKMTCYNIHCGKTYITMMYLNITGSVETRGSHFDVV